MSNLSNLAWIRVISLIVCGFFILNLHSKSTFDSYHDPIWADAAGYYSYLPALFEYSFQAESVNDSLAKNTGNGFELKEGKIVTKYSYGVALLNAPGYLIAKGSGAEINGNIDPMYHYMTLFTALIFVLWGFWFLERVLAKHVNSRILVLLIPLMLFGTNLLYYTVDKGGMAHSYLFFLFAASWYSIDRFYREQTIKSWLLFCFFFGLAVLIRPTSVLALVFFVGINPHEDVPTKMIAYWIKRPKYILTAFMIGVLIFIPQMIYWDYAFEELIAYSYGDEGFSKWASPQVFAVLFSPHNGWLLYTPMAFLMLVGLGLMLREGKKGAIPLLITLGLSIYAFSSWWSWYFGCSLGARSFVEYYAFLALPTLFLANNLILKESSLKKIILGASFLVCFYVNIKLTYTYDDCFYGTKWDFSAYEKVLFKN